MIPPEADAEFVAYIEDVLDLHEWPHDPNCLVVNMDEQPVQLVKDTCQPLPAEPGQPQCSDHEYEQAGTAWVFLFTEALSGWRHVSVLTRQCLRTRTPSLLSLVCRVTPWAHDRNTRQRSVDWQFTMENARIKLIHLYPQVQLS